MSKLVIASAPAKVILSGEHTVVYGYPALVSSVSLYSNITLEKIKKGISICPKDAKEIVIKGVRNFEEYYDFSLSGLKIILNSDIPVRSGMGSSAAIGVSLAAALLKFKKNNSNLTQINTLANLSENHYHKNNSGVDAAISTYGGILWYRKETENFKITTQISPKVDFSNIEIINSGIPKETTGEMVSLLAQKYKEKPRKIKYIFTRVEDITRNFLQYINGNLKVSLKDLIFENEKYLEELGVVSSRTRNLIRRIEKIGGSAKISGAGGHKSDSGILLVYHQDQEKLHYYINKQNLILIEASFGVKGVKIEKD
jgi:mevalonate kinase